MTREIPLTRGAVALVDDEDYDRLIVHKWHLSDWRAGRQHYSAGTRRFIPMHREVLGFPDVPVVDHVNGNPLDNRRANLRPCTQGQNCWNMRAVAGKRVKGVQRSGEKWRARIRIGGRLTHLGVFADEESAARAYDNAARKHFGEFACVNFPEDGERAAVDAA